MKSAREIRLFRMVRIVCALVFVIFSFTFLSIHQAPLLEVVYDITATGKLQYDENITAAIITFALLLVTLWLNKYAKFSREWEAMAYLPACVILAFITNIDRTIYTGIEFSWSWVWIAGIAFFIYVFASWVLKRVLFMRIKDITRAANRIMWRNLLLLSILFCFTGVICNDDENFKHEAMVYHYVKKGDFDTACRVAARSFAASQELTAGRAYLLAHEGVLGEKLFTYPQYYGVEGLLPREENSSPLSASMVYDFLKVSPEKGEGTIKFLSRALSVDTAAVAVKDYYLSALLLDKRLEEFVDSLPRLYNVADTANLPLHYKEALLLCSKVFPDKESCFTDAALEEKYSEMLKLEQEHQDILVRSNYVRKFFGKTYWWYYLYAD
ncbi:MAG: hypothetical protein E7089_07240 [Bacteroidales bacterium]|nr:hypothetical protein [Bacteroidales bacterium]